MGIEGVGEAVTGGMLAREVEPGHGEASAQERVCLNCSTGLTGPYCHQCGQKGHLHRTLRGFGHDLLHGVLHFEGKVWRTLPMLAWRPGELTRRYIEGERARFVSPIALFLFSVFLMFAVFGTIGGPFAMAGGPQVDREAAADMQRESDALGRRIADLERRRQALAAGGQPTAAIDAQLAELRQERRIVGAAEAIVLVPSSAPEGSAREIDLRGVELDTGWPALDRAAEKARENPSLLLYKLQSNAYKFSWVLIPISVPFVALLFLWRRRYTAYDHVVFVTYSIAAMSLLLIVLSLIRPIVGAGLAPFALTFLPPLHMYRQLKGAYGLRRLSAIWRTAALLLFALMAAILFFLALVGLGLFG